METSKEASHPKTRNHRSDPGDEAGDHGAAPREAAKTRNEALRDGRSFRDLRQTIDLSGHLKSNPYGTLAAVAGVGYVLGGGLFSSTTRRVLGQAIRMGLRLGALVIARQRLTSLIDGFDHAKSLNHPQPQEGAAP